MKSNFQARWGMPTLKHTKSALIILYVIFLVGCSGSKQLKTGDEQLDMFLVSFKADVEAHRWDDVLDYFAIDNFLTQKSLGVEIPQYIEEGILEAGINNGLTPRNNDNSPFRRLNHITRVIYKDVGNEGAVVVVSGVLRLGDGSTRQMKLYLESRAYGIYRLAPPVG